jgi:hypothetical protein
MKTFKVAEAALRAGGEHVLGSRETGSHACYLIYGSLGPGEGGREICPGRGHEEIVMAIDGELEVSGAIAGTLPPGEAFHVAGQSACRLRNPSASATVRYVCAGGHAEGGHH